MSTIHFTETIKNLIEALNEIYEQQKGLPWSIVSRYLWNVLDRTLYYIFTLQWIYDFKRYPIILPKISESIFADLLYRINPILFSSETEFGGILTFLQGFLNCFFLFLPLSAVQFIWIRRFVINGALAGVAASLGIVFGYCSFLGCCLFGFREIIFSWYGLEPLSYFLGVWLIFTAVLQMLKSPLSEITEPKELLRIFGISFGCVWTDQSSFFQTFGNLSFQSGVSTLDWTEGPLTFYFLGLFLGSIFWTSLIGFMFWFVDFLIESFAEAKILPFVKYKYSSWAQGFNSVCLIGCMTLTLTSFPYYGFGYLFSNPLGFVARDSALEKFTLLKTDTTDVLNGRLGYGTKSAIVPVDTDLSIFDRGRYSAGPIEQLDPESLNYQGEYLWRSRVDRMSATHRFRKSKGIFHKYLVAQFRPMARNLRKKKRETRRIQKLEKIQQKQQQASTRFEKQPNQSAFTQEKDKSVKVGKDNVTDFIDRFIQDYAGEANLKDPGVPNLAPKERIRFSALSEIMRCGWDCFSLYRDVQKPVAQEIKERFSENIIYRFLLRSDISSFLKRQKYALTSDEEIDLFQKRKALGEYYDTLRSYSKLPIPVRKAFGPTICGSKSYSSRIYNQQFKGTSKIVRRLFSIHLENEKNLLPVQRKTSYVDENRARKIQAITSKQKRKLKKVIRGREIDKLYFNLFREPSVLKYDQPLYKTDKNKKNALLHESIGKLKTRKIKKKTKLSPFIQETNPLPFFAGWDHEKRKFVVTNRLLTRDNHLKQMNLLRAPASSFEKPEKLLVLTWPINFKDWPILNTALTRLSRERKEIHTQDDVFYYTEPLMDQPKLVYSQLPSLVSRVESDLVDRGQTVLSPKIGGWVWNGNTKTEIQQILQKWQAQISKYMPSSFTKTRARITKAQQVKIDVNKNKLDVNKLDVNKNKRDVEKVDVEKVDPPKAPSKPRKPKPRKPKSKQPKSKQPKSKQPKSRFKSKKGPKIRD